jgi:hypothetical protein
MDPRLPQEDGYHYRVSVGRGRGVGVGRDTREHGGGECGGGFLKELPACRAVNM